MKLITRLDNVDGLVDCLLNRIMEKNWGVREATFLSLIKYYKEGKESKETMRILERVIEVMEKEEEI